MNDPISLQLESTEAPRARAEALARALGSAMPGVGDTTFAHLNLALPAIHAALGDLLATQLEVVLEGEGRILGVNVQAPGFPLLLQTLRRHGAPRLVLRRGITQADLHVLLDGLLRNPVDLEVMGGLRGYLERNYIQSIQLQAREGHPSDLPTHLVERARTVLQAALTPPDTFSWGTAGWLHYVSDLRGFGPLGAELGLGAGPPAPLARALVAHLLDALSPDQLVSLGRGMASLPRRPHGMVVLLQEELQARLPGALQDLLVRGLHWLILHHPIEDLVAAYPGPLADLLGPLREGLAPIQEDPLVGSFLEHVAWQAQNLKQQLDQTQASDFLALPPEARAQLLERCLKAHRLDALTDLLGALPEEVQLADHARLIAILESVRDFLPHTLGRLAPDYLVGSLEAVLLAAYRRHPGEQVGRTLREGLVRLFQVRLQKGQAQELKTLIDQLEAADGQAASQRLMGSVAPGWIRRELETEEMLDLAIACIHMGERMNALTTCMPYFQWLEAPLFQRVAWRLGREEVRHRRDRMLRVLTAGGEMAEAAVSLQLRTSIPWFFARNLLVVLSSVGLPRSAAKVQSFLDHDDGRVRLAALRALRQCTQGRPPLPHLIARLEDPDEPLRIEAIRLLAVQQGLEAQRALCSVAQDKRVPEAVRIAAVEGLASVRDAVPLLRALAADKGGFLRKGESEALRAAATATLSRLR